MPRFKDYIMQQRQLAYEAKNSDLMRITEELANVAFADIKDENVPVAQKVKSLEILLKALREDAAAQESSNIITVGIEDDEDDED